MFNKISLYFIERVITLATGLGAFIILARFFGPSSLGQLSFVQALSAASLFMVTLGLDRFVVKSLVEKKIRIASVLITATSMRFVGWLIYSVFLFAVIWLTNPRVELFTLVSIEVVANFFMHVIVVRYFYEATGQIKELVVSVIASRSIAMIYLVLAIYFDAGFLFACLFLPIQTAIRVSILLYFLFKKQKTRIQASINTKWAKEHFKLALPLMLSGAIFPIFMQADIVMLDYFYSEHEVGLYAAPMKIIMQIGFLGDAAMTALFPILVSKYANDRAEFSSLVSIIARALFLVSICMFIFVFLFSDIIVDILFGKDYTSSIATMQILSILALLLITARLYSALMIIFGFTKYELVKAILAVLLNISLNLVLIPKYSILGAAIASVISYLFSEALFYLCFKKLSPIANFVIDSMKAIFYPIKTIKNTLILKDLK